MNASDIDTMVSHYVECLLWAGQDWSPVDAGEANPIPLDTNYGPEDLAPSLLESSRAECTEFYQANKTDLAGIDAEQAGHDFYLTRNHHGTGFWDRGYADGIGKRLTDAAHVYGETNEYAQDGKVYSE